jgi:dihydrodipicolinate synthase/N-acetylneuraminate lyase
MRLYRIDDDEIDEVGLYDICEWFIKNYPDDIFIGGSSKGCSIIVEIRERCKEILEMRTE